jgi:hypothetical protein
MKIKDSVYKLCDKCNMCLDILEDEVRACDCCKKKLVGEYLLSDVFVKQAAKDIGERPPLEFCSWKCCIKTLKKTKTNYFISLPYLNFESKQKGMKPADFFTLFKKL